MTEPVVAQKFLRPQVFWRALVDAGVFSEEDTGMIQRIVIDVDAGKSAVMMYVERWADERLLQVVSTLDGIEIRGVPKEPNGA